MTKSEATPISTVCSTTQEQNKFMKAIKSWVGGETSYFKMMEQFPSYELLPHERLIKQLKNIGWKKTS